MAARATTATTATRRRSRTLWLRRAGAVGLMSSPPASAARRRHGALDDLEAVVSGHDLLNQRVAHDILSREFHEGDAGDALENLADHDQPGAVAGGQVDLGHVPRHHDLRSEA